MTRTPAIFESMAPRRSLIISTNMTSLTASRSHGGPGFNSCLADGVLNDGIRNRIDFGRSWLTDPWAFGWTQVFTLIGLAMSGVISFLGLRTFDKWKREKVEERRLEVAYEALTIAYESQMVFDDIRRHMIRDYEWADMPKDGLSEKEVSRRQSLYGIIKRMERHTAFFDRVLVLQPKFMAVFGKQTEAIFLKLHKARHSIQIAIEALMDLDEPVAGTNEWDLALQMRSDIFDTSSSGVKEPKRVTKMLEEFRAEIEALCAPLINKEFKKDE
jgi:hypothetical protein